MPAGTAGHRGPTKQKATRGWLSLRALRCRRVLAVVAEWTGLEPATPGVTGRYSDQLNYHSW